MQHADHPDRIAVSAGGDAAAFVVVANFAVDLFYAVLDPRVRAH